MKRLKFKPIFCEDPNNGHKLSQGARALCASETHFMHPWPVAQNRLSHSYRLERPIFFNASGNRIVQKTYYFLPLFLLIYVGFGGVEVGSARQIFFNISWRSY